MTSDYYPEGTTDADIDALYDWDDDDEFEDEYHDEPPDEFDDDDL